MKLDWTLLRKQKADLIDLLANSHIDSDYYESIDGIIYLLDEIQDNAVNSGEFTEWEVFGDSLRKCEACGYRFDNETELSFYQKTSGECLTMCISCIEAWEVEHEA